MSPLTSAPPVNASSTACGSRRTDLSATALEKARSCAMYRAERATPRATRGTAFQTRARGQCAASFAGQADPASRRPRAGAGCAAAPLTGLQGHVAACKWCAPRRLAVQAPEARFGCRFSQFRHPGVRFSSQKYITARVSLSSAPVLAPGAWFFSGFCYRSVEEEDTDTRRSVACKGAIRNIPRTSPL